jgi:hypothetical protein
VREQARVILCWPGMKRHDKPGLGPLAQPANGHDMTQWELVSDWPDTKLSGPPQSPARAGPGGKNGHLYMEIGRP